MLYQTGNMTNSQTMMFRSLVERRLDIEYEVTKVNSNVQYVMVFTDSDEEVQVCKNISEMIAQKEKEST